MNERIQELAKEAGFFPMELTQVGPSVEKLAELIIKECVEVAHCNFHVDGLTMGVLIKEHFGVE